METLDDLKDQVYLLLVTRYDFLTDEATESVEDSLASHPDFWNENADPDELAKTLAEDD